MFYLCRGKNKTLFWANKALFYRLRKRNANKNIKKTASSRNFWICREYAFCLPIWSRLCMRMRRPVQDGLYCESLWNPAKVCTLFGPACICQGCSGEVPTPLSGLPSAGEGGHGPGWWVGASMMVTSQGRGFGTCCAGHGWMIEGARTQTQPRSHRGRSIARVRAPCSAQRDLSRKPCMSGWAGEKLAMQRKQHLQNL